jgi:hypothetical protein
MPKLNKKTKVQHRVKNGRKKNKTLKGGNFFKEIAGGPRKEAYSITSNDDPEEFEDFVENPISEKELTNVKDLYAKDNKNAWGAGLAVLVGGLGIGTIFLVKSLKQ